MLKQEQGEAARSSYIYPLLNGKKNVLVYLVLYFFYHQLHFLTTYYIIKKNEKMKRRGLASCCRNHNNIISMTAVGQRARLNKCTTQPVGLLLRCCHASTVVWHTTVRFCSSLKTTSTLIVFFDLSLTSQRPTIVPAHIYSYFKTQNKPSSTYVDHATATATSAAARPLLVAASARRQQRRPCDGLVASFAEEYPTADDFSTGLKQRKYCQYCFCRRSSRP
jgi:hypothetical protein